MLVKGSQVFLLEKEVQSKSEQLGWFCHPCSMYVTHTSTYIHTPHIHTKLNTNLCTHSQIPFLYLQVLNDAEYKAGHADHTHYPLPPTPQSPVILLTTPTTNHTHLDMACVNALSFKLVFRSIICFTASYVVRSNTTRDIRTQLSPLNNKPYPQDTDHHNHRQKIIYGRYQRRTITATPTLTHVYPGLSFGLLSGILLTTPLKMILPSLPPENKLLSFMVTFATSCSSFHAMRNPFSEISVMSIRLLSSLVPKIPAYMRCIGI